MEHIVYIGIGSNLGDRWGNCVRAVEQIRRNADMDVMVVSRWRESKALTLGEENHPTYVNGAAKIATNLSPRELLTALKGIENEMGRSPRREKWSPRTIDLDILFYEDVVLNKKDLIIPHPEIQKRLFVLKPLCDIDPRLIHPVLKKAIGTILKEAEKNQQ